MKAPSGIVHTLRIDPQTVQLSETELIRLLGALLALLITSQLLGNLFQALRQPRVIGEILGGLLFGPTVLGALWPASYQTMFGAQGPHQPILGFVFWLGLLLLMFCSGMETPIVKSRGEWRVTGWLTLTGTMLPLLAGWGLAQVVDFSPFYGEKATPLTFGLLVAMAVSVTSIPVISKIFFDLGLMGSVFSRVVLSTAIIEDVLLWVLLSITLQLALADGAHGVGLWQGVLLTLGYFAFCDLFGHRLYDGVSRASWNPFKQSAQGTGILIVLLATTLLAYLLGINPIFGAFLAGRIVARSGRVADEARQQIKGFGFAFFIPVYLASVGLKLNLLNGFEPLAFVGILLFACIIKSLAAYGGARLAGLGGRTGWHLAIALNARGGPGIVLATVALEAQLITAGFYAVLILLALVTSQLAGWWLERVQRRTPEQLDLTLA